MNSLSLLKNEINEFTFIFLFFNFLSNFNKNFNYFFFFFFFYFSTLFKDNEENSFKNEKNLKKIFFKLLFYTEQCAV